MPVKRSRIDSSSSLLAAPPAASVSQVKVMKAEPAPPPKILTFSSPVTVGAPDQTRIGEFLERCHYCKKLIPEDSEIFMYSNLCAFCSAECRDIQIELDQSAEKQLAKVKENLVLQQGVHK